MVQMLSLYIHSLLPPIKVGCYQSTSDPTPLSNLFRAAAYQIAIPGRFNTTTGHPPGRETRYCCLPNYGANRCRVECVFNLVYIHPYFLVLMSLMPTHLSVQHCTLISRVLAGAIMGITDVQMQIRRFDCLAFLLSWDLLHCTALACVGRRPSPIHRQSCCKER